MEFKQVYLHALDMIESSIYRSVNFDTYQGNSEAENGIHQAIQDVQNAIKALKDRQEL